MANTFLTPSVIAKQALANLYETTVMASLVHRDYEEEFANKVGQTITIRKPAVFEAKEFVQANGIEVQNATETDVALTLNHFLDVSFAVTSKDLALNIRDFNEQLLNPAMEAISQGIDKALLELRDDITQEVGVVGSTVTGLSGTNQYAWSNPRVAIDAERVLNQRKLPPSQRYAVIGPDIKARWLGDDLFTRADARGDTEGLREANLGRRIYGFDPYMTQNITIPDGDPGDSSTEVGIAFHKTALALAFRPLALPKGAVNAAVMGYKGFGLRVVMDYDVTHKQDIVSVDCLFGTKTLDANRAVLIKGADVAS